MHSPWLQQTMMIPTLWVLTICILPHAQWQWPPALTGMMLSPWPPWPQMTVMPIITTLTTLTIMTTNSGDTNCHPLPPDLDFFSCPLTAFALLAKFGRFASMCTNTCCCWQKSLLVTQLVHTAELQLNGPSPSQIKPNGLSTRFPLLYPHPASLWPQWVLPFPLFCMLSKSPFCWPFSLPRSLSPTPPLHLHLRQNILNPPVTFISQLIFCFDVFIHIHKLRKCCGGQQLQSLSHCIRQWQRNQHCSRNNLRQCSKGLFRWDQHVVCRKNTHQPDLLVRIFSQYQIEDHFSWTHQNPSPPQE